MDNVLNVVTKKEDLRKALDIMFETQRSLQDVQISGLGKVSKAVLKIAKDSRIELVKDLELMKHLIRLESSNEITEELYPAVAEIMARMYKVSQQANWYN